MTTPPSSRVADARAALPPPRADVTAAAGLLTLAGAMFWPIAMTGEFDARDYLGVLAGGAAVILLGLVLLVARGSRTLGAAMLAGGLPVASMQVWWLLTDSWANDWPVPVSSLLLTAAGLTAAFARRDPAVPSRHRRRAFGLTAIGLVVYVVALAVDPGWYSAVIALVVLLVPAVVTFGALVGAPLGPPWPRWPCCSASPPCRR